MQKKKTWALLKKIIKNKKRLFSFDVLLHLVILSNTGKNTIINSCVHEIDNREPPNE